MAQVYDAVFLSRWDVLWHTPLLDLSHLGGWHERRPRTFWLPRICVPVLNGTVGASFRNGICGGGSSNWLASQAARECSRAARACQPDMTPEARELYVMDWRAPLPPHRRATPTARCGRTCSATAY